jgi:hypothetical protein
MDTEEFDREAAADVEDIFEDHERELFDDELEDM